ncbi:MULTISPECIES: aldose epimerase family protein [unclassified Variovorax]|jgi:aldose 1-epimerase|uniref:aldose epimerase family protein n=1 Tax=unclassified Variovorax TaxID=663243 RepID=UPI000F7E6138|nr:MULTISPECIES: aldose epimerase family protein [unclassified Variovorax]RSZ44200.1 galactose mutarotase [Variovorax sp. 553]RSZ45144.1 galactose mutarotase [Variovorax sp. 679]
MSSSITSREYGRMPDGRAVTEYTLDNGRGLSLSAINLGGIVTALRVPDRHGRSENIVLGLPTLADYLGPHPHLGTIVGRYANRISGGRFTLDGKAHQLGLNNGPNSLHGGATGFGKRYWEIAPLSAQETGDDAIAIELGYTSADGEEGYPGEVRLVVRYTLSLGANTWRIDYSATTDRPTVLNLSHHDYFNLAGSGSVMDHRLTLAASRYCPVDATLIPQGIAEVAGTPFDFRAATRIGERIREGHEQLLLAHGYDHNWVLDRTQADHGLALAARLEHEATGRVMEVHTSEPGVQFYSGNFLDGSLLGSAGASLRQGDGLCLETQHFPDSPNRPDFPSTVLRPSEVFRSATEHRFGIAG